MNESPPLPNEIRKSEKLIEQGDVFLEFRKGVEQLEDELSPEDFNEIEKFQKNVEELALKGNPLYALNAYYERIPPEFIKLPSTKHWVEEMIIQGISHEKERGCTHNLRGITVQYGLTTEFCAREEITNDRRREELYHIKQGVFKPKFEYPEDDEDKKFEESLPPILTEEFLKSEEVHKAGIEGIKHLMSGGDDISEYTSKFGISETEVQTAAESIIIQCAQNDAFDKVSAIKLKFPFQDEFLNSKELKNAYKTGVLKKAQYDLEAATNRARELDIDSEISHEEFLDSFREGIEDSLKKSKSISLYRFDGIEKLLTPQEVNEALFDRENKHQVVKKLTAELHSWNVTKMADFLNWINPSQEIKNKVGEEILKNLLRDKDADNSALIQSARELLNLSDDAYEAGVSAGILNGITYGDVYDRDIKERKERFGVKFDTKNKELQSAAREIYFELMAHGNLDRLYVFNHEFSIDWSPDEKWKRKEAIHYLLTSEFSSRTFFQNDFHKIKNFIDSEYPETHKMMFLRTPEVLKSAEDYLIREILSSSDNYSTPEYIIDYFAIDREKIKEIILERIRGRKSGWEISGRVKRVFPDIDVEKERHENLMRIGEQEVVDALKNKHWSELYKLGHCEEMKDKVNELLEAQYANLLDSTKSYSVRMFALECLVETNQNRYAEIKDAHIEVLIDVLSHVKRKDTSISNILINLFNSENNIFIHLPEEMQIKAYRALTEDNWDAVTHSVSFQFAPKEIHEEYAKKYDGLSTTAIPMLKGVFNGLKAKRYFNEDLVNILTENNEQKKEQLGILFGHAIKQKEYDDLLVSSRALQAVMGEKCTAKEIIALTEAIPGGILRSNWNSIFEKYINASNEERTKVIILTKKIGETMKQDISGKHFSVIFDRLSEVSPELQERYLKILAGIEECQSQELRRIRDEIINQIVATEDPEITYKKIESVFIENNIPFVGKILRIFNQLHKDETISQNLISGNGSRVLKESSPRMRQNILYRDMMNIHVKGGNSSLAKYAEIIGRGQVVLTKAETNGWNTLSFDDLLHVGYLFRKLQTLYEQTQFGQKSDGLSEELPIPELYKKLRSDLQIKEGQNVEDRIAELFLRPIGINSFGEMREVMKKEKERAHERNIKNAQMLREDNFSLTPGDLMKGIEENFFSNILQNGSVAKEFLGGSASSDSTPLDTDLSRVKDAGTICNELGVTLAKGYGNMLFVIKDRGQFQDTTEIKDASYDPNKYELFQTLGDRHYGIRTGFPLTEIDCIIDRSGRIKYNSFDIAKNGYYIPLVDDNGKILFSIEEYEKLREIFSGVKEYGGDPLLVSKEDRTEKEDELVSEIVNTYEKERKEVVGVSNELKNTIFSVLREQGVTIRDKYETSISGAEFHDTGSTSRGTNKLREYDFDFGVRLDTAQFGNAKQYADALAQIVRAKEVVVFPQSNGYVQFRAIGITKIGTKEFLSPVDLDIGFGKKADDQVFGSHSAVTEKLDSVEETYGEDTKKEVIANIILAKKMLSDAGCYKKIDGGIGGIGVENWILKHGGSLKKACLAFRKAARPSGSFTTSLSDIKKIYSVYDAGTNIRDGGHEDFMDKLNDASYKNMLEVVEKYLDDIDV